MLDFFIKDSGNYVEIHFLSKEVLTGRFAFELHFSWEAKSFRDYNSSVLKIIQMAQGLWIQNGDPGTAVVTLDP